MQELCRCCVRLKCRGIKRVGNLLSALTFFKIIYLFGPSSSLFFFFPFFVFLFAEGALSLRVYLPQEGVGWAVM
ncbi:hypothetical protein TRSC58_07339 [Trypanosoma rangeli SC58]|uniref:Uncharacterized protein n=1 Tax=Trypanosoma rangeli SC58 TaxID=429131 RepID=A0A061IT35_TRYRA|nr:hypothetical protein TRSC58_07339 [Trypanosoma rangeli SC58]